MDEKHDKEYDSKNYTIKTSGIDMRARIVVSSVKRSQLRSLNRTNKLPKGKPGIS